MKKVIAGILAILTAAGCLAGCGSKDAPAPDASKADAAPPSSQAPESNAPEKGAPVTLTVWATADGMDDRYKEKVNGFMDLYPEITIDTVVNPAGDGSELMTAFASGTGPDYCGLSYPMMHKYIYSNTLTDLTDRFQSWEDAAQIDRNMMDMFKVKDRYYGVPSNQYAMVLYYNKELFEEAGLTPPTTWEEMIETGKKLTDPSKQQYGFALDYTQWAEWWFEMFVWSAGGDLTKQGENGELITTFTDPAVIEAAQFYRDMKKAGIIQPDASLQLDDLRKEFALGRAAMTINATDQPGRQIMIDNGMDPENLGMAPIPKGPADKGISQVGGALDCIPVTSDSAKEDAAWKYLTYLHSKQVVEDDFQNAADNGIASYVACSRLDVDVSSFYEFPKEASEILSDTANSSMEFYGKAIVGTFVDQAVQEIMADDSRDITAVFEKYEQEANKKEVPDYNAALSAK